MKELPKIAARSVIVVGGLALVAVALWALSLVRLDPGNHHHLRSHMWPWPWSSDRVFVLAGMFLLDLVIAIAGFVGATFLVMYLFELAEWD